VPFQFAKGQPSWEEVWGQALRGLQGIGLPRVGRDKILVASNFLDPVLVLKRILLVDTDNKEVFRLIEQSRHRPCTHERRSSSFMRFGKDFRVEGPAVTRWFGSLTYEFVSRGLTELCRR
jgi:hypothetical protein